MRALRTSVALGLAVLFGCGAAPQIDELQIVGAGVTEPPAALREALDRDVASYGRNRFTVRSARYALAEDTDRDWQPLLSKLAETRSLSRMERVKLPALPRDLNVALWRSGKADGVLVAMPKADTDGKRLVGHYAIGFADGFDPPARGDVEG